MSPTHQKIGISRYVCLYDERHEKASGFPEKMDEDQDEAFFRGIGIREGVMALVARGGVPD